jgi:DNA polymerase-1
MKDFSNNYYMDPPQIDERFGVGPDQIIDYLTIVGDVSDNVPGVKGVGPVGASKLLKRYGTLDKAIKAAKAGDKEIKPAQAKALVDAAPNIETWRSLIRLEENVPLKISPKDCSLPKPDTAVLTKAFTELEFGSLLKEMTGTSIVQPPSTFAAPAPVGAGAGLPAAAGSGVAVLERPAVSVVLKEVPFGEIAKDLVKAKAVVVAALKNAGTLTEGAGAHVALGLEDGRVSILTGKELKQAAPILSGKAVKVGYALKEAESVLESLDLSLSEPRFDALMAAYCLSPVRPKLDAEASSADWRVALRWRARQAFGREDLERRMMDAGVTSLFLDVEMPLVDVLRRMERLGISVDSKYLRQLAVEFEGEISDLQKEIDKLAGAAINVNSPKQLGELLYDKLGLPVPHKTAKGGRSTDEESLQELASQHALPGKILQFREYSKLKSTYIDGLLDRVSREDGRVHTTFEQTGTETGRISSLHPNLQNIPVRSESGQRIRRAFVADKGFELVSADYSQIDLRVLAHVSGDAVLRDSFAKNEDVHTRTACEVFRVTPDQVDKEMRRRSKAVNFGIVYGQTPWGLSAELGIPQKEAAAIIHAYFERYEGVKRWIDKNREEAHAHGYVKTFLGRVRHLPELAAKNAAVRQFGERAAGNTPIQGGSADVIKLAMLNIDKGLQAGKFKARMLLQIHDELLFEVPKAEVSKFAPWAREQMEKAVHFSVPLVVDVKVGKNWQDMEKLK